MNKKRKRWNRVWERTKSPWETQYPEVQNLKVTFQYDWLDSGAVKTTCMIYLKDELLTQASAKKSSKDRLIYSVGRELAFKRAWRSCKSILGMKRKSIGCVGGV
jgi:hypothetical protein